MLKRVAVTVLPISILLGIFFSYLYYQETQKNQILIETTEEAGHIQVQLRTISENFKFIISDLLFLSEQQELKALLDGAEENLAENLASDYLSFSLRSGFYDQIRFIDTEGREVIRVNYNNGKPSLTSKEGLQDKSGRYYFKNSFTLERGEIYVSPLDLNIEEGKVELPIKPMIRFATPVFDSGGNRSGIIVLNFLGSTLISHLRNASHTAMGEISLINAEGYWLFGPDPEYEWAFMFENKKVLTFQSRYHTAWERISREESGQFYAEEGLFTFGTVHPLREVENAVTELIHPSRKLADIRENDDYIWKTVSRIPAEHIEATKRSIARKYLLLFITTSLVVAVFLRLYFGATYYKDIAKGIIDESEEVFKALSEAAYEGVIIADGLTVLDCNKRMADMLGYEQSDIIGKRVWDFIDTDFHEIIRAQIISGFDDNYEGLALRKDGTKFPFKAHGRPLSYKGKDVGVVAIRDITEQKKAEESIKLMAMFAEMNPAPVLRCDGDGNLQVANPAAMELLKMDKVGESVVTDVLPGVDFAQIKRCIEESSVAIVILRIGDKEFQFAIRGSKEAGVANIYGADITDLVRAQAELRESHERFLTLMDSLDAIVYVADMKNYEILYANKYLSETLGVVSGEKCWESIQLGQDGPCKSCTNSKLLIDGEPGDVYISESRNTRNGNWYLCRDRAIRWIDGRIVRLEIATDITHLKETEKTLTKAKEEAEEATRIKDKFVSLVSHDLRAPLGTIMGFLSLLRRGDYISLPDDVAKMIDASIDSGENMVKLIEDVLSASRLKTGKIVPNLSFIDLYGLTLKAVVNSRLSASRKGIELINDVPVNSRVYVDTTLMYEVLQNLVSNAIKFCSKGDTIRLSIPEGERTTLVVADSGKGISTEDLENLFSYEVKTTTPGTSGEKGTGLGLPLAYDIVKAHGGTLEAESVVGNGSEFRVKIPYARPTLLYVDDEKFARALYRLVLKNLDVNIIEAENGVQALEEMERMKPDLVITDINMPEMDGFELIENIRGNPAFDSVSIIALTSDDSIETRDRCFRLGANDFSSKEVSAADFIPRVRRYIG